MVLRTLSPTDPDLPVQDVLAAIDDDGTVFVDADGTPRAVVISVGRLQRLRDAEAEDRRREALAWLDEIEAAYAAQPNKLSPEQVEQLADRFSREFYQDLAREGKITFEREFDE